MDEHTWQDHPLGAQYRAIRQAPFVQWKHPGGDWLPATNLAAPVPEILRLAARVWELEETVKELEGGFKVANEENDRHIARIRDLESVFARQADMCRAAPVIAQGISDRDARIAALEAENAAQREQLAQPRSGYTWTGNEP